MATLANGPIPLTLNGETFLFTPLTHEDIDTLDEYVRGQRIDVVRKSFPASMKAEDKRFELEIAYRQASALTWVSSEGARLMRTINGMAFLAWVSLRKKHPDVTLEQFKGMMSDPSNIDELTTALHKSRNANPTQGLTKKATSTGPTQDERRKMRKNKRQQRKKSKR